jgi:hypothetical protein
MTTGAVPGTILIATRIPLEIRAGELVTVQVLKLLAEGKWAVGLRGRVFPATSAIALNVGDRLSAVVERAGRRIVLRLADPAGQGARAAASAPSSRGASADEALTLALVHAFLREGRPPDDPALDRARARLRTLAGEERKTARGLAVAVGKGIDPDSPGLEGLFSLLHFEDDSGRGGYRRRRLPRRESEQAAAVKSELARGRGDNALSLFNALRGDRRGQGTWVVVPFAFHYEGRDLEGTVRLLYAGTRPVRMALDVKGAASWGFLVEEQAGRRRLRIFREGEALPRRRVLAALGWLREKLHNHDVEVDDTIGDARAFDGYSAERGGAVDLLG